MAFGSQRDSRYIMGLNSADGSPALRMASWYFGQALIGCVALCAGPAVIVSVATMTATTKRLISASKHVCLFSAGVKTLAKGQPFWALCRSGHAFPSLNKGIRVVCHCWRQLYMQPQAAT